MFLDEELLSMCMLSNPDTADKIQQINRDIKNRCTEYARLKAKSIKNLSRKDAKSILDRTFNLFNSFVRMAKKDKDSKVRMLGDMFEKYDFKTSFLNDDEMREFYESL